MEHFVKLSRLPANLSLPERLAGRLSYDPAKAQLSYRGFMTKCTYDELAALNDDSEYRRALEQLFVLTSEEVIPRNKSRSMVALMLAAVAAVLVLAIVAWAAMRRGEENSGGSMPAVTASTAS